MGYAARPKGEGVSKSIRPLAEKKEESKKIGIKELRRQNWMGNADRRKGFARSNETFCAEHHPNVFDDTEVHGSADSWKTNAAFRHVSWSKLSRGVSRTQQSGVCREVWRFFARA